MTMTYRNHASALLVSLCTIPLLTACPGGTGDLGSEEGPAESSGGQTSGEDSSDGAPTSGPATMDSGEDSSGGTSTGTSDECTEEECGPAPGEPAYLCQDGVTWAGPGPCERGPDGTCGYTFVECPACCYAAEQPQDCIEGSSCCAD